VRQVVGIGIRERHGAGSCHVNVLSRERVRRLLAGEGLEHDVGDDLRVEGRGGVAKADAVDAAVRVRQVPTRLARDGVRVVGDVQDVAEAVLDPLGKALTAWYRLAVEDVDRAVGELQLGIGAADVEPQVAAVSRVVDARDRLLLGVKVRVEDVLGPVRREPRVAGGRIARFTGEAQVAEREPPAEASVVSAMGVVALHDSLGQVLALADVPDVPGPGEGQAVVELAADRITLADRDGDGQVAVEQVDVVDTPEVLVDVVGPEAASDVGMFLAGGGRRGRQEGGGGKGELQPRALHGWPPGMRRVKTR
jgi:hypothetical protein